MLKSFILDSNSNVLFILQIQREAIAMSEFEQKLLPALIEMSEDKVPNVRLVVGKCLYKCAQTGELIC